MTNILRLFDVTITGLTEEEKWALVIALLKVGSSLANEMEGGQTPSEAFKKVFNSLVFNKCGAGVCERDKLVTKKGTNDPLLDKDGNRQYVTVKDVAKGMITYGHTTVGISGTLDDGISLINNFIHELGHVFNITLDKDPAETTEDWITEDEDYERTDRNKPNGFYGKGGFPYQQAVYNINSGSEQFADMFIGWAWALWANSDVGKARREFMNKYMPGWVSQ